MNIAAVVTVATKVYGSRLFQSVWKWSAKRSSNRKADRDETIDDIARGDRSS